MLAAVRTLAAVTVATCCRVHDVLAAVLRRRHSAAVLRRSVPGATWLIRVHNPQAVLRRSVPGATRRIRVNSPWVVLRRSVPSATRRIRVNSPWAVLRRSVRLPGPAHQRHRLDPGQSWKGFSALTPANLDRFGLLAGNDSWLPREKVAINRPSDSAMGGGYETGDQRHRMAGLRQQSAEPRHLHHLQRRLPLRFPQDPLRQIPLQSATTELGRRAVGQGNARTQRNRPIGLLRADRVLLQRLIRARSTKCARCSQGRIWG